MNTDPVLAAPLRYPTTDITNQGNRPGDGPYRPGGMAMSGLPMSGGNLPSTLAGAAQKQQAALAFVRDLWEGTDLMRTRQIAYLPRDPGEDSVNYVARVKRSVFYNVFRHTVVALAGFVFRRDPRLQDDVPEVIRQHWENIDNAGTHGDVFLRDLLQDDLIAGHAAILVDYPDTGGQRLTLADEQALRPYWVPIKKENILSWRVAVEEGRQVLMQVVLREIACVEDGAFGDRETTQYRVLWRTRATPTTDPVVGFQLLQIAGNDVVMEIGSGIYGNQTEIPLVEVSSSGRRGLFDSSPPLLDLAYLNVAHYQQWSDYANSLHKTCVPIFVTAGLPEMEDGTALVLGTNNGINFSDPNGKAMYVSHDGRSLGACQQALVDLEHNMAALGISMLVTSKRVAETAEAKRMDKGSFDSALAATSRSLQDAVERALDFHARYLRLDDGGSIKINRDFENLSMQSDLLGAYAAAVANAGIPVRYLLEAMQEGGLLPPDEDLDAVEQEVIAGQAAQQEQARLDQQAKVAALTSGDTAGAVPAA